MNVMDFLRGLGSSVASNNPVTMAIDTGANIADLGIAAAGYLGHKSGMLTADQMPEPLDKSAIPGSSEWLNAQFGVNDSNAAMAGNVVGMFAQPGKLGKGFIQKAEHIFGEAGANQRIAKAKSLMAQGVSKEDAWRKTGVAEFGPNHWVSEVSSQGAKFKYDPSKLEVGSPYKLTDVFDHPGLKSIQGKKAQESIGKTVVRFFPTDHPRMQGARGGHLIGPKGNEIWIGLDKNDPQGMERALSTALHENQHNLTSILGGWKGGAADQYTQEIGTAVLKQAQRAKQGATFAELIQKHGGDVQRAEGDFVKRFPDSETWSQDEWIQMRYAAEELASNWKPQWIANHKAEATKQIDTIMNYKRFALEKGVGEARYASPEYVKYIKQADEAAARAVQARARMSQQEIYENPFWDPGMFDSTNSAYTKAMSVGLEDLEFVPRGKGTGLAF